MPMTPLDLEEIQRPSWMKELPEREAWRQSRWAFHRQHPEMDWYDYRHASRQSLGEEVVKHKLIYLDTKYWIFMRDVFMDRPQKALHSEIFVRLYGLVRKGKCLCPFSYPIFCELHKQSDPNTRKMTAHVIDLFSGSVCLQNPDALTRGKILGFFRKYKPEYSVKIQRRVIVWTKAGFCLGEPIPTNPAVPPDVELLVQKVVEDHSLSMTLEELVDAFIATGKPFPMPSPQYEKLNANKAGLAGAKDFVTLTSKRLLSPLIQTAKPSTTFLFPVFGGIWT